MSYSVYLSNPFLKPLVPLLQPNWTIVGCWDEKVRRQKISALATTVWDIINKDYLLQFPNLKIICHLGIGTENIEKQHLQERNIPLLSQPNSGIHDTAELALTLMLTLARKILPNDRYIRDNLWVENKPRFLGNHLFGKQIGLVGLGKIGSRIAHFAEAFGMKIAYTTRNQLSNQYAYYSDVSSLAGASDFLVVCCSGGPETYHLINKTVLANLGPNGYLINVSRGSVIDQDALIEALKQRIIAGAGLDVFAQEPEVPLELRNLDNLVLSPHMGSSTKENLDSMFKIQAQQLNHYLLGVIEQLSTNIF